MSKPHWVDKTDPERYPDRYMAALWSTLLAKNFGIQIQLNELSGKQFGQFADLRRFLGEWTSFVIEWMTVPRHWRHFTGMIQMEVRKIRIPLVPNIGFLVQQRTRALKIMREYLRDSVSPVDIRFVCEQDLLRRKNLLEARLLLSGDKPEILAKIVTAKTPAEIQQVFAEIVDGDKGMTAQQVS
jgi:hypothetical protein